MTSPGPSPEARHPQGTFAQALVVAVGAGLASATLFGLSAHGALLSSVLAAVAPMPIMAAGLGFTHWAGLLAALVGGFGLSASATGLLATLYFLALALPAWHLARLAITPRRDADGRPAWRPISELALWATAIGVFISLGWIVMVSRSAGGDFDAAVEAMARKLGPALESWVAGAELPEGVTAADVARAALRALPVAAAGSSVTMMLGNLWLAGRVTRRSDLLPRPWPDLARAFEMPRVALGLLAGGMTLGFLDGMPGRLGWIVAAATFMGFALQGVAAAHFLTRPWPQRRSALFALYVTLAVIPWSALLVGLFGLADSLFGLRARSSSSSNV